MMMSIRRVKSFCGRTLVFLGLLAACTSETSSRKDTPPERVSTELTDTAWEEALALHRQKIDEDFTTSPTSPMAGTQYLKSEPGEKVFLTRTARTFALADAARADAVLMVERGEDAWHWEAVEEAVTCDLAGASRPPGSALASSATFAVTDLTIRFVPSDDRVTFIVFDPERPEKQSFEHLLYFAPDRRYAVPARLVKLPKPEALEMPTTRGLIKTFYRFARVEFEIDGEKQALTAFKYALAGDSAEGLFIPFRDTTTGHETYGAGRYLQIADPEGEDFVLDFNRAFNPLCNYSPAYNCTLPPHENHLQVPIRAGEKTYPDAEGLH
jgi:uncharacterized protein (DUF1684 family)